jgi:putative tricarboxylic transport membrane protein
MVLEGLMAILTPENLLYIALATTGGLVIGALPGLTATMGVAVLVPITFGMNPTTGLAVLGALYMSAIYGGAFSAILINTPGTPGSIATALDGYPMCVRGDGEKAIIGATFGSMCGGLVSLVALFFLAPPLAAVSLRFGPPEYFWLAVFGLTVMSSMGGGQSVLKTFIAGGLGLLISCIGITRMAGELRFGFGISELQGGIELVAALIGLFCIPEALNFIGSSSRVYDVGTVAKKKGILLSTIREMLGMWKTIVKSSVSGVIVGMLPGAGGTIANLIAYNDAKRSSKHPAKFGTGILEGVVAPETANNATVGGGLIPTLTLGVPGTPVAAVIYGALLLHGLRPGAELFTVNGRIVYGFMFAIVVSTLMMGVIGITMGVGMYKAVSRVPVRFLAPAIIFLSVVGSYAVRNNSTDVIVMLIFGVLGYVLKELDLSPGALVLGLILGPIAEEGLVQASLMARALGFTKVFITRPISLILVGLTVFSFIWPLVSKMISERGKGKRADAQL